MKLISYAQNFEDVLLWRALGHVANGFYIDAGANDPVDHSVTKAFYDAGWHGINIEPLPAFAQLFDEQRPRDINLAVAAGAAHGSLTLYDVPAVNGWASPQATVAEAHRAEGYAVSEITVPVRTLASICAEHVTGEIHFLKIDVEGFEGEVLQGMDLQRWRPWILVVEATLPNSRETNHATWEPLVTAHGYDFAWFDGLNRYYVAREHAELGAVLSNQPNVFDNFISYHTTRAWADKDAAVAQAQIERRAAVAAGEAEAASSTASAAAQRAAAEAAVREAAAVKAAAETAQKAAQDADAAAVRHDEALQQIAELGAKSEQLAEALYQAKFNAERVAVWARELEATVKAMSNSTSWRMTRPLRLTGTVVHLARRGALLREIVARVTASERMRRLLLPILQRAPWVARKVSVTLAGIKHATPEPGSAEAQLPEHIRALPVSARTVLADLKRARSNLTPGT
ncbi:methyltransferase FkbM [Massilia eurypsychrophila]|uniref:Methyltransferase FkbM n=1 Tax=Massilia eurypsychrophila TaxID=1485217 RepID=A0A2G8TEL5_9BURK|nr:FkbM family methyltransferase [Massilia eurypsychrophila]PIL44399.1 methyltransferase FkbM [Massilia eurypsychrophila]